MTGHKTSRFFRWEDVPALHALVSEKWRRHGPWVALHIGDLYWRLRPQPGREPRRDIRLWHLGDGGLAGFAWFDHAEGGVAVAHPDADGSLEMEMLDWFEAEAARRGCSSFTTGSFLDDERRLATLEQRGYIKAEYGDLHLLASLDDNLSEPIPPEGYSVGGLEGPHQIELRAAVHRDAWSRPGRPSAVTTEVYQRLVELPGYRQELDLVATGPDGDFVSCMNAWYDEDLRVGAFEPVGCRPEHRNKGVTRALMLEGLRRLRDLGATQAIVCTSTNNPGAQALYESSGFSVVGHDWSYTKERLLAVAGGN